MNRIVELKEKLNYYTKLYDEGKSPISDKEWDDMYFELLSLENGIDNNEITYQVVNELKKIEHNHKMLSLGKTKEINEVSNFIGNNEYIAMPKMDGLTCSLRYIDGKLISAETRGNGLVGEDITHNALVDDSIPNTIKYKEELIIDGEVICKEDIFEQYFAIDGYRNPRNFAAGSIRLLSSKEYSTRKLTFVAWEVIKGYDEVEKLSDKLSLISTLGFETVPTYQGELEECIEKVKKIAKERYYPIDGVVFKFNNVAFGNSLGENAHHKLNAIAYKFYDELYDTCLIDIEYDVSRNGILTPVAIFETVEIDGTECSRASLHNLTVMEEILKGKPYKTQKIQVCKRNMIIPQIENAEPRPEDKEVEEIALPEVCPICGGPLKRTGEGLAQFLKCDNLNCPGRIANKIEHFASKKGIDIKGLSRATIDKLLEWEWITSCEDLFKLNEYQEEWVKKSGFGEKSVNRILTAIEQSKNCSLDNFIASLGIPLIGITVSRQLGNLFNTWENFRQAIKNKYRFYELEGFGIEMHNAILKFNYEEADRIAENYIVFLDKAQEKENEDKTLEGNVIVITGKLHNFKNRGELQSLIEAKGGKVTSSVSKNTNCLINNDNKSTSTKNMAAIKLNIPIYTEEEFIKNFLTL